MTCAGRRLRRRQIRALDHLALQRRSHGRYHDAEGLARRALTLAERTFPPGDAELAAYLNNLGVACKYTGRFNEAETLYRRALPIAQQAANRSLVATLHHNLGGVHHAAGRHADGEPFARRAVELREHSLGPDHLDTVADVAALASIIDAQGRHHEAEPLFRRALVADHPNTIACRRNGVPLTAAS